MVTLTFGILATKCFYVYFLCLRRTFYKSVHIFIRLRILAQTDILNITHIHLTQQNLQIIVAAVRGEGTTCLHGVTTLNVGGRMTHVIYIRDYYPFLFPWG